LGLTIHFLVSLQLIALLPEGFQNKKNVHPQWLLLIKDQFSQAAKWQTGKSHISRFKTDLPYKPRYLPLLFILNSAGNKYWGLPKLHFPYVLFITGFWG